MKIYHGTSFENAAKILSLEFWSYNIEQYIIGEIKIYEALQKEFDYEVLANHLLESKKMGILGNHFTTNVHIAEIYAKKNMRPVILMVDFDGKGSCDDFIIESPIHNSRIKCYVGITAEIEFYGALLNELYEKEHQSNFWIKRKIKDLKEGLEL